MLLLEQVLKKAPNNKSRRNNLQQRLSMHKTLSFIDIETTGLDPNKHEIIEIAVISCTPEGVTSTWECKVAPKRIDLAHPKALEINQYCEEDWVGAKDIEEIIPTLVALLQDSTPVAHNASFDKSFIEKAVLGHKIPHHWVDTVSLAHVAFPDAKRYSLSYLCSKLGISNEGAHTALADAERCRLLYERIQDTMDLVSTEEE
jgi:DNA polymerase III subunit epsilon